MSSFQGRIFRVFILSSQQFKPQRYSTLNDMEQNSSKFKFEKLKAVFVILFIHQFIDVSAVV